MTHNVTKLIESLFAPASKWSCCRRISTINDAPTNHFLLKSNSRVYIYFQSAKTYLCIHRVKSVRRSISFHSILTNLSAICLARAPVLITFWWRDCKERTRIIYFSCHICDIFFIYFNHFFFNFPAFYICIKYNYRKEIVNNDIKFRKYKVSFFVEKISDSIFRIGNGSFLHKSLITVSSSLHERL